MRRTRVCAVALHDVAPATTERCMEIRQWLSDRGVERATLLVIPARDLHPFDVRSPDLCAWLRTRAWEGDAMAQHGFRHLRTRRAAVPRRWIASAQGGEAAEFPGLDLRSTRSAVRTGTELMAAAGLRPRGFVAPAYAYTRALRAAVGDAFDWWAGLIGIHRRGESMLLAPACGLGSSTRAKRALSPVLARAGSRTWGDLVRIDVHPADFDHPRHVRALETMLRHARGRAFVSYDQLVGA
jgi:predicted deacetylase